jgi:hypothetical protein
MLGAGDVDARLAIGKQFIAVGAARRGLHDLPDLGVALRPVVALAALVEGRQG